MESRPIPEVVQQRVSAGNHDKVSPDRQSGILPRRRISDITAHIYPCEAFTASACANLSFEQRESLLNVPSPKRSNATCFNSYTYLKNGRAVFDPYHRYQQTLATTDELYKNGKAVRFEIQTADLAEDAMREQILEVPQDDDDSQSSICVSPTWTPSVGAKEKKRLEKEKRKAKKRLNKGKKALEAPKRKVEEERQTQERKYNRPSVDASTSASKPTRPSLSLRRLSTSPAFPPTQFEKEESRRLPKGHHIVESSPFPADRMGSTPERRPSILSRTNTRWTQSFSAFQLPSLCRTNGGRLGKELDEKSPSKLDGNGQCRLKESVQLPPETCFSRETPKVISTEPPNPATFIKAPYESSIMSPDPKFASDDSPSKNDAQPNAFVPCPEPPKASHTDPPRKLTRKATTLAQSPRQRHSQDRYRLAKDIVDATIQLRVKTRKTSSMHTRPPELQAVAPTLFAHETSTLFAPLQQDDTYNVKVQNLTQSNKDCILEQQDFKAGGNLKQIQILTGFRKPHKDQRDAQILVWNNQVAAMDVLEDGFGQPVISAPGQEGDGNAMVSPCRPPAQTTRANTRESILNVGEREEADRKRGVHELPKLEVPATKEQNDSMLQEAQPTKSWRWSIQPLRSLWYAKSAATSDTSSSSRSSQASEALAENLDTALASSPQVPQGQRSRCSSTTIKPPMAAYKADEYPAASEISKMWPTLSQVGSANHVACGKCAKQDSEEMKPPQPPRLAETIIDQSSLVEIDRAPISEHDRWSHKPSSGGPGEYISPRSLAGDTNGRNVESMQNTSTGRQQSDKENAHVALKLPATKTSSSQAHTSVPQIRLQPAVKDSQEKFSTSDGTESISRLSAKSTSLSSSFDKCSLPMDTSANTYTTRPASYSRRSLSSSFANKPRQVAKMFIICCKCCRWHDPTSDFFHEFTTAKPFIVINCAESGIDANQTANDGQKKVQNSEREITKVECHWCNHEMRRQCCATWNTLCSLHERYY
jgi:hypothetical protein